jgi:hypothetical protein
MKVMRKHEHLLALRRQKVPDSDRDGELLRFQPLEAYSDEKSEAGGAPASPL